MDTRTGRIYTAEEVEVIFKKMEEHHEYVQRFEHLPIAERPQPQDLKPMIVAPTEQQLKTRKVGRNDPCPCGSDKKFKKCCYQKEWE